MTDPTIRDIQRIAWANKLTKGFNTTDVPLEFGLLHGEIAEAFDAWRMGGDDLGEELADVLIFLVALAEMNGIDLGIAVERKLAKNAGRTYDRANGAFWVKTGDA